MSYRIVLKFFDAKEAIEQRRTLHTFQNPALLSLDTPTGLPPHLDQQVRSSAAYTKDRLDFPYPLFSCFGVKLPGVEEDRKLLLLKQQRQQNIQLQQVQQQQQQQLQQQQQQQQQHKEQEKLLKQKHKEQEQSVRSTPTLLNNSIRAPFEPLRPVDYRFGPISVEWKDRRTPTTMPGPRNRRHPTPIQNSTHDNYSDYQQQQQHHHQSSTHYNDQTYADNSDNISDDGLTKKVDVGFGVVHLYHDRQVVNAPPTDMLAVLAIPATMSLSDFLNFLNPSKTFQSITNIRMLRDAMPNRCMALLKFSNAQDATSFLNENNGKPFWAMFDDEICHIVPVASVQVVHSTNPPFTFPFPDSIESNDQETALQSSSSPPLPPPGQELPTCPVCLERMDSSVTGLITIMCQHTFHCHCLSKWENSKCPVCRYSQVRWRNSNGVDHEFGEERRTCDVCGESNSTWICLICGHVGCGRYHGKHAVRHFEETVHLYAMELETQRVWDYGGDVYVHRLLQDRADGKLVELPPMSMAGSTGNGSRGFGNTGTGGAGPNASADLNQSKIEAIGFEYSHLLTTQLDTQRAYYEDRITGLKHRADESRRNELILQQENDDLKQKVSKFEKTLIPNLQNTNDRLISESESLKLSNKQLCQETESLKSSNKELKEKAEKLESKSDKLETKSDKYNEQVKQLQKDLREEKEVSKGLWDKVKSMKQDWDSRQKETDSLKEQVKDLQEQLRDVMFTLTTQAQIAGGSSSSSNQQEQQEQVNPSELAGGDIIIQQQSNQRSSRRHKRR